jgi:hypothetical protein
VRKLGLLAVLVGASAFAAPIITVTPVLGPDYWTSSNFDAWAANVITGMQTGLPQGSGVTAYTPLSNGAVLTGNEFIESDSGGFTSWMGMANPTGSFANEYGTAMYFSVSVIDSEGVASFSLNDLEVYETYLGQSFGWSLVGGTYRPTLVGITQDGSVLNNGEAGDALVKEIWYVGVGFVQPLDPSGTGTNQQKLDYTLAGVQSLQDKTTEVCYAVGKTSSCASVEIGGDQVPEPGTIVLMGAGLAGLALLRRRK